MIEQQSRPCCAKCQWSGKLSLPLKPKRLEQEPLAACSLHSFVVWSPDLHFCSQFSSQKDNDEEIISNFPPEILEGFVYVWMQIRYRDLADEDTIHNIQRTLPVTTFNEYTQMTPTQKSVRYSRMHNRTLFELKRQLAPAKIMSEELYQKGARQRKERRKKNASNRP
jgi:hypothetical protein